VVVPVLVNGIWNLTFAVVLVETPENSVVSVGAKGTSTLILISGHDLGTEETKLLSQKTKLLWKSLVFVVYAIAVLHPNPIMNSVIWSSVVSDGLRDRKIWKTN
jgi:hypothetical protein